jgi:hypothetical protein
LLNIQPSGKLTRRNYFDNYILYQALGRYTLYSEGGTNPNGDQESEKENREEEKEITNFLSFFEQQRREQRFPLFSTLFFRGF